MKNIDLFTIKPLNYELLLRSAEKLPHDAAEEIRSMVRDHKLVIEYRTMIIEEQLKLYHGLFDLPADPNPATQLPSPSPTIQNGTSDSEGTDPQALPPKSETSSAADEGNNGTANDPAKPAPNPSNDEKKGPKKPRGKKLTLPKGTVIPAELPPEQAICCGKSMTGYSTRTKTVVFAMPLLQTKTFVQDVRRCSDCGAELKATLPEEARETCGRYHYSTVAQLAALRYQYGGASYRIEAMSANLGLRISDSTQWAIFEEGAALVQPFVVFLKKYSANATTAHTDDTHNLILDLVKSILAEQEAARKNGKNPDSVRSGIHTTNFTAIFPEGPIVLYKSGLHHAGEILARILTCRTVESEILVMADAASTTESKLGTVDAKVNMANCNSHALRKAKELAKGGDSRVDSFLKKYKMIFENDKKTKDMTPKERLSFHIKESLPIMEAMRNEIIEKFDSKSTEPNSDLGKVLKYFTNHFKELCAFCHYENAPLTNDLSERMLKCVIRHRRNSLFFKTEVGAAVADIFTTILFTAQANKLNSIEYLTNLLRFRHLWRKDPEAWLPWNYTKTMASLKG